MKNKLKHYVKLGILLFGVTFFIIACQKDDIDIPRETIHEKKMKLISLSELNLRISGSKDYNKLIKLFDVNKDTKLQQKLEASDNPWIITRAKAFKKATARKVNRPVTFKAFFIQSYFNLSFKEIYSETFARR